MAKIIVANKVNILSDALRRRKRDREKDTAKGRKKEEGEGGRKGGSEKGIERGKEETKRNKIKFFNSIDLIVHQVYRN